MLIIVMDNYTQPSAAPQMDFQIALRSENCPRTFPDVAHDGHKDRA